MFGVRAMLTGIQGYSRVSFISTDVGRFTKYVRLTKAEIFLFFISMTVHMYLFFLLEIILQYCFVNFVGVKVMNMLRTVCSYWYNINHCQL